MLGETVVERNMHRGQRVAIVWRYMLPQGKTREHTVRVVGRSKCVLHFQQRRFLQCVCSVLQKASSFEVVFVAVEVKARWICARKIHNISALVNNPWASQHTILAIEAWEKPACSFHTKAATQSSLIRNQVTKFGKEEKC